MSEPPVCDALQGRHLHPRVLTLWRLRSLLAGLPGVLAVVAAALVGAPPVLLVAAGLLAVPGVGAGWWWAGRRFARFSYRLDGEVLRLEDGVVVLTESAVPLFRVQHIDVDRGPLERWLGLASLSVHTAAPGADLSLPGVAADEAIVLRDEILAASRDAAVRFGLEDLDAV